MSETKEITICSVAGFIETVKLYKNNNKHEYFYRGHPNKKYELKPSLFRTKEHKENEDKMYRELLTLNPDEFQQDVSVFDKLVRMQHYSMPTRMLDITFNPLIALYIACKNNNEKEEEAEGEIIMFSTDRKKIKYFDSDTVSCIANLAVLPPEDKKKIKEYIEGEEDKKCIERKECKEYKEYKECTECIECIECIECKECKEYKECIEAFNSQEEVKHLIHFIKREKPFFESRIRRKDIKKILCVKGKRSNTRIISQSGAFLLFGLNAKFDEEKGTDDIKIKKRIRITNKEDIITELDLLNINESTVFPDIEESAKYVSKKFGPVKPAKQKSAKQCL